MASRSRSPHRECAPWASTRGGGASPEPHGPRAQVLLGRRGSRPSLESHRDQRLEHSELSGHQCALWRVHVPPPALTWRVHPRPCSILTPRHRAATPPIAQAPRSPTPWPRPRGPARPPPDGVSGRGRSCPWPSEVAGGTGTQEALGKGTAGAISSRHGHPAAHSLHFTYRRGTLPGPPPPPRLESGSRTFQENHPHPLPHPPCRHISGQVTATPVEDCMGGDPSLGSSLNGPHPGHPASPQAAQGSPGPGWGPGRGEPSSRRQRAGSGGGKPHAAPLEAAIPSAFGSLLFLCLRLSSGRALPGAETHFSLPFLMFFYLSNLAPRVVDGNRLGRSL